MFNGTDLLTWLIMRPSPNSPGFFHRNEAPDPQWLRQTSPCLSKDH